MSDKDTEAFLRAADRLAEQRTMARDMDRSSQGHTRERLAREHPIVAQLERIKRGANSALQDGLAVATDAVLRDIEELTERVCQELVEMGVNDNGGTPRSKLLLELRRIARRRQ